MTGFLIVLAIIAILVIIILIQRAKGKSDAEKIELQKQKIATQEFKEVKRQLAQKARIEHGVRVRTIKQDSTETTKKIKGAKTDEELEAILADIDNDNNSRM